MIVSKESPNHGNDGSSYHVRSEGLLLKAVGWLSFAHFLLASVMDSPRAPKLALLCDMREMDFRNKVSNYKLKKIFRISCTGDLEAIKLVLG
ncbi:hypothetical protein KI387_002335, partial [Taxus chinensis]